MREVGHQTEEARLDAVKQLARSDVNKLRGQLAESMQATYDAYRNDDWHLMVAGLRKALAVGLLCKPVADRIEREILPQPERLPGIR